MEISLVLPVFLILVLAAVDFGMALRAYNVSTNAAREGARLGTTGQTMDNVTARVVGTSSGLLTSANVTVTGAQGETGSPITVSVAYSYSYITPLGQMVSRFLGGALPSPLPIVTSATMRME